MIVGLQIGKETSTGSPGKNYMNILGRQLNEYSLMAAYHCKEVDLLYISTDSPAIMSSAKKYDAKIINRPKELATPESLTEDVLIHAYDYIKRDLGFTPEMIVLLFANTPTIDLKKLSQGIKILRDDNTLDSCFSVARYNMFSPTRAKVIDENNILSSAIDLNVFGDISSIRSSQGDIYFADLTIQIMKPICFKDMYNGNPPLRWMGKKTYALKVDYGFDLDENWQIPVLEHWLFKNGFTKDKTPYDL